MKLTSLFLLGLQSIFTFQKLQGGFELPTSISQISRSATELLEHLGTIGRTSPLTRHMHVHESCPSHNVLSFLWRYSGTIRKPSDCRSDALPIELYPLNYFLNPLEKIFMAFFTKNSLPEFLAEYQITFPNKFKKMKSINFWFTASRTFSLWLTHVFSFLMIFKWFIIQLTNIKCVSPKIKYGIWNIKFHSAFIFNLFHQKSIFQQPSDFFCHFGYFVACNIDDSTL